MRELSEKYDLIYLSNDEKDAFRKIDEWMLVDDLESQWQIKRERMLNEKIDVTEWLVDFVEEKRSVPKQKEEVVKI